MNTTESALLIFEQYIANEIESKVSSWSDLANFIQIRKFKKGDFIVKEGKVFSFELFLVEGIFRSFLQTSEQEEVNLAFYEGPQIVAPYQMRNINDRHLVNFETLTDCVLILMDAQLFSNLIRTKLDIRTFAFLVLEKESLLRAQKEAFFISQPANSRLQFFREKYPGLENKIAQHHIASYLGISPVSLSRLRNSTTK